MVYHSSRRSEREHEDRVTFVAGSVIATIGFMIVAIFALKRAFAAQSQALMLFVLMFGFALASIAMVVLAGAVCQLDGQSFRCVLPFNWFIAIFLLILSIVGLVKKPDEKVVFAIALAVIVFAATMLCLALCLLRHETLEVNKYGWTQNENIENENCTEKEAAADHTNDTSDTMISASDTSDFTDVSDVPDFVINVVKKKPEKIKKKIVEINNVVRGVAYGACKAKRCRCNAFERSQSSRCDICDHAAMKHENLHK